MFKNNQNVKEPAVTAILNMVNDIDACSRFIWFATEYITKNNKLPKNREFTKKIYVIPSKNLLGGVMADHTLFPLQSRRDLPSKLYECLVTRLTILPGIALVEALCFLVAF